METEKPRAKPGMLCPRFRRDVSKVCHKCKFYEALQVAERGNPADVKIIWDCVDVLRFIVARDIGFATNGVQQATESFRNQMLAQGNVALRLATDGGRTGEGNGYGPPALAGPKNINVIPGLKAEVSGAEK